MAQHTTTPITTAMTTSTSTAATAMGRRVSTGRALRAQALTTTPPPDALHGTVQAVRRSLPDRCTAARSRAAFMRPPARRTGSKGRELLPLPRRRVIGEVQSWAGTLAGRLRRRNRRSRRTSGVSRWAADRRAAVRAGGVCRREPRKPTTSGTVTGACSGGHRRMLGSTMLLLLVGLEGFLAPGDPCRSRPGRHSS